MPTLYSIILRLFRWRSHRQTLILLSIPVDLLLHLTSYLDPISLYILTYTSRALYTLLYPSRLTLSTQSPYIQTKILLLLSTSFPTLISPPTSAKNYSVQSFYCIICKTRVRERRMHHRFWRYGPAPYGRQIPCTIFDPPNGIMLDPKAPSLVLPQQATEWCEKHNAWKDWLTNPDRRNGVRLVPEYRGRLIESVGRTGEGYLDRSRARPWFNERGYPRNKIRTLGSGRELLRDWTVMCLCYGREEVQYHEVLRRAGKGCCGCEVCGSIVRRLEVALPLQTPTWLSEVEIQ